MPATYAPSPTRLRVAIVVGSTRPGRNAAAVADWVATVAARRDDASFAPADSREEELAGMLDELTAWGAALRTVREPARA